MKKLLLSLGTMAAIATPVAAVVACGSTPKINIKTKDILTLDQTKALTIISLDSLKLDPETKTFFTNKINNAKTKEEVKTLDEQAVEKSNKVDGLDTLNQSPDFGNTDNGDGNIDGNLKLTGTVITHQEVHHKGGDISTTNPLEETSSYGDFAAQDAKGNLEFERKMYFDNIGTVKDLENLLRLAKAFNNNEVFLHKTSNLESPRADLVKKLEGKMLRVEIYFRTFDDKYIYIETNEDVPAEMKTFKFDKVNKNGQITKGSLGVAIVLNP